MPRTDKVEPPGCSSFRAICFDNLGLIKVLESTADKRDPQIVARWGEPDPQRSILSVSLSVEQSPVLAIARKNQIVEILDPSTGALRAEVKLTTAAADQKSSRGVDSDATAGIHIFRADSFGTRSILTCTEEGNATLWRRAMQCLEDAEPGCPHSMVHDNADDALAKWRICNAGSILCLRVDFSERHAAFGGKGVDVNLWNLESHRKIWEAKTPRRDNMGLISHPFVTASAFLCEDHRKLVVGTGHHQIRLYDVDAQRRPVLAFDFSESPINAVEADPDGYTIFVGTGNGDLASFDMRTGKMLGAFKGKCSGSIRSIARHPELPIIASCGLDRYLRVFDVKTRQLLARVFLKQQLVAVVLDSKYPMSTSSRGSFTSLEGDANSKDVVLNGKEPLAMGEESQSSCIKKPKRKLETTKERKKKKKSRKGDSGQA